MVGFPQVDTCTLTSSKHLDQWERKSAPLPQEPSESVQYAGLAVARHAAPPLRPNAAWLVPIAATGQNQ